LFVEQARPVFIMGFDLKKLIEFAKKNHEQFRDFSYENIEKFFELYAKTTIIRQDRIGNINGFCVCSPEKNNKIEVLNLCLIGDTAQNFRDIRNFLHRWEEQGIEVNWQHQNANSNVFGILADVYDSIDQAASGK